MAYAESFLKREKRWGEGVVEKKLKEVILTIPDFHRKGGTGRVMVELVNHLSKKMRISVVAGCYEPDLPRAIKVVRIPYIKRPQILKFLSFFVISHLYLLWKRKRGEFFIWSTGSDCVIADLITMHDCAEKRRRMAFEELLTHPFNIRKWNSFLYHCVTSFFERVALKRARKVIAVSDKLRRDITKAYPWCEGKIRVIHNGVNPQEFGPHNRIHRKKICENYKVEESRKILMFIGGEWSRKNLEMVLKVHAQLPSDYYLFVIGKGSEKWLKDKLCEYEIQNRVTYIPFTAETNLFVASADVLLLLSVHEPFGLPVLEAMASGIPVIVSEECGVSEIIEGGKDGFVVSLKKGRIEEVSLLVKSLCEDRKMREEMGKRAREKALFYSWERISEKYFVEIQNPVVFI